MDSQWALGHDPRSLPTTTLSPLHHQHVVGEGCPELEALQHWLCLPLLYLLYLHNHLVTRGLRKRFRANIVSTKQFHRGGDCAETSETPCGIKVMCRIRYSQRLGLKWLNWYLSIA